MDDADIVRWGRHKEGSFISLDAGMRLWSDFVSTDLIMEVGCYSLCLEVNNKAINTKIR